jgi:hypothetical protein
VGFGLRSARRLAAAALVFAVGLAGCARGPLHDALNPRFISGSDAADRIEVDIGALIVAHHPGVTVGRARCPFLINVSGDIVGRCTLPVAGQAFRIDVRPAAIALQERGAPEPVVSREVSVVPRDVLLIRNDVEREVADQLEDTYPVRFTVRCPGPAMRIAADPIALRCSLAYGRWKGGFARVQIAGGDISVTQGPKNVATLEQIFSRRGTVRGTDTEVVDGLRMQRYIYAIAGDRVHAALTRRGLIHAAHCPAWIAFKGRGFSACTVVIGTHIIRYSITYTRAGGLDIGTSSFVEVVPDLRELSERYYARVLPLIDADAAKIGARVHSDCGRDIVAVVQDDETIPCQAHIGKETLPFHIDVGDDGHEITFDDSRH